MSICLSVCLSVCRAPQGGLAHQAARNQEEELYPDPPVQKNHLPMVIGQGIAVEEHDDNRKDKF